MDRDPREALEDWSEHGLGLYLDPRNPDTPLTDEKHRRIWMSEAWEWIVRDDPTAPMPPWTARPALTRFTVSSPKLAGWFAGFDASVTWSQRMRPGSFGLMGQPATLGAVEADIARPARGYERDPAKWEEGPWYDRKTRELITVTFASPDEDPERFANLLAVRLQTTLGDMLARFRLHPEHKSLGPDDGWAHDESRGPLQRRPVQSAPVLTDLTGKEGNKIIERLTGEVTDPSDYRTDYGGRADRWRTLVVPVLRSIQDYLETKGLAVRVGQHRRSVERVLRPDAPVTPHASTRGRYTTVAAGWIRDVLSQRGASSGPSDFGALWCGAEREVVISRVCEVCGRPVTDRRARYCGTTCKKRAYRQRHRSD